MIVQQEQHALIPQTRAPDPTGTQDPQAEIEVDAKRVVDQLNRCRGGAVCSNQGVETLSFTAIGQSILDSDSVQKLKEKNKCEGVSCTNLGTNDLRISATGPGLGPGSSSVDSDIEQNSQKNNDCEIAGTQSGPCTNSGTNSISLTASTSSVQDQTSIENDAYQKIKQDNKCEGVFSCDNFGRNDLTLTASDSDSVDSDTKQELYQNNDCDGGAQCQNPSAFETITITASGRADIENEAYQKIKEDNKCEDSSICTNNGRTDLTISASGPGSRLCRFR